MEMNRDNFFTRLFGRKKQDATQAETFIDEKTVPTVGRTLPHTLISFTEEQLTQYNAKQRAELQKKLLTLPPLRVGEVNFVPYEAGALYGGYFVRVFIRNGRDLEEDFALDTLPLYLIDATHEKVAGGVFRPQNFGTLKFGETRVWTFAWRPEEAYKKNADLTEFTVAFS